MAAAQARQDRRGPSLRAGLKSDPEMEPDAYKHKRFLDILIILGSRRLRPGPARTAADLVFVLASKVTQNGAGLL